MLVVTVEPGGENSFFKVVWGSVFLLLPGVIILNSKLWEGAAPVVDGEYSKPGNHYTSGTGVELLALIRNFGLVTQVACL